MFVRKRFFSAFTSHSIAPLFCLLNKCYDFNHVLGIHGFMVSRGFDKNDHLLSKFIQRCSSLGFTQYACLVVKYKEDLSIHLYNMMMKSLVEYGSAKEAVFIFNRVRDVNLRPDMFSFSFVLKAVANLGSIKLGQLIHSQVYKIGFHSDVHILTGLINIYSVNGEISNAGNLFDEITNKDSFLYNVMLKGYVKNRDLDNAIKLFDQMPERNLVSWTTLISGCAQMKKSEEAISLFQKMQFEDGIKPDKIALISVLTACADLGQLDLGNWIYSYVKINNFYNKSVTLMNALIDMYAKCGNICKAREVFDEMSERNIVTWTTIISGLAFHGLCHEADLFFNEMEKEKIKPNEITFLALLSACCHNGFTKLGQLYFNRMKNCYKIKPKIEHYGCMIDLLTRAGLFTNAINLIKEMPFEPNKEIWGSILSAARTYNNIKIGEIALVNLIELEPENSGNYVVLCNIYASENKWDKVKNLRNVMREKGVVKFTGLSSIEINGEVHEFTSRDGSHYCLDEINKVVLCINKHLRAVGYKAHFCDRKLDF